MTDNALLLLLAAGALMGTAIVLDWRAKRNAKQSDAARPEPLLTALASPRAWAKARMVMVGVEALAARHQAKALDADLQDFMAVCASDWRRHAAQAKADPLDVQLQRFMLQPAMTAMLQEADAGLIGMTPTEVWQAVFACVLIAKTHDNQQLAAAIQRLEERAAERSR